MGRGIRAEARIEIFNDFSSFSPCRGPWEKGEGK